MKPHPLLVLLICISSAAASSSSAQAEIVPVKVEKTLTEFVEPPPLDPTILGMMKTNTLGTVEARIYFVESWDIASLQKAQVFVSMLAKSEPDDQRKLAHASVRQVANTNYALLRHGLFNPRLPRPVLSVFMTDVLKRDNKVRMPALLTLARSDAHPMQAEAEQLLTVYLGQNYGTNWLKWEEALLVWLERNPK